MKPKQYTTKQRLDKIEKKLIQLEHALEKIAAYIYYLQNNDKEDTQVGESSDTASK